VGDVLEFALLNALRSNQPMTTSDPLGITEIPRRTGLNSTFLRKLPQ
jgi:hypothetical protein